MQGINNHKQALEMIEQAHYILILTHQNPDADTISCGLALSNYFSEHKIKHKVFNKDRFIPQNFDYMNRFDKITDTLPKYFDLVIYVDCGDINRPDISIDPQIKSINIDHHQSNDNFATVNIVNSDKSSTAEIVYEFFKTNNLTISKNTAICLYTGIYDDSLKFSTPRTNSDTFQIATELVKLGVDPSFIANNLTRRESLAKYRLLPLVLNTLELHQEGKIATIYLLPQWLEITGASHRDCEDAVNMVLNISVVQIAIFFRISNGKTRISLRSKGEDVSVLANHFNGGGHKLAAGCSYDTLDVLEAKEKIIEYIKGQN